VKPRRTQRALYRSKVSAELNLCLEIHLSVTTLEPTRRGTRSKVLLVIKASYSSSMAQRQDGSARAAWMKVSTRESGDDEVADNVSLSVGSQKPRFTHMVIG
jgi:Flp pilus assembly protein TadD